MNDQVTRDIETLIREQVLPAGGTRHGLVVGIERHRDARLNLRCARKDAASIYQVMTDPECGLFPKSNVTLLLDAKATRENIRGALADLRKLAGQRDVVWIYYAGHAAPEAERMYWVTYDADVDDLFKTALGNDEICRVLNDIRACQLVVLLDCCYAAATVIQKNPTRALLTAEQAFAGYDGMGRITLTASDGKEKSIELGHVGHGAFTYYLESGLRGDADRDGDGVVTVEELWQYLRHHVSDASGKAGNRQTPMLLGQMTHDVALTLNPVATQEKRQVAAKIESLVGLGDDRLTTDEANLCLELLRRRPHSGLEKVVVQDLRLLVKGGVQTKALKLAVQAALQAPSKPDRTSPQAWQGSVAPIAPLDGPRRAATLDDAIRARTTAEFAWERLGQVKRRASLEAAFLEIEMARRNAEAFFAEKLYSAAKTAYDDIAERSQGILDLDHKERERALGAKRAAESVRNSAKSLRPEKEAPTAGYWEIAEGLFHKAEEMYRGDQIAEAEKSWSDVIRYYSVMESILRTLRHEFSVDQSHLDQYEKIYARSLNVLEAGIVRAWHTTASGLYYSFTYPNIPSAKLSNARARYAAVPSGELIVGLRDLAFFSHARIGLLVTTRSMYWRNTAQPACKVEYSALDPDKVTYEHRWASDPVLTGQGWFEEWGEESANAVCAFIRRAAEMTRRYSQAGTAGPVA